jgi:hypothetical protein
MHGSAAYIEAHSRRERKSLKERVQAFYAKRPSNQSSSGRSPGLALARFEFTTRSPFVRFGGRLLLKLNVWQTFDNCV